MSETRFQNKNINVQSSGFLGVERHARRWRPKVDFFKMRVPGEDSNKFIVEHGKVYKAKRLLDHVRKMEERAFKR